MNTNKEIAKFIFGMVDMSVASELPEEEQLKIIENDLKAIEDTDLYYYLINAYENSIDYENNKSKQ